MKQLLKLKNKKMHTTKSNQIKMKKYFLVFVLIILNTYLIRSQTTTTTSNSTTTSTTKISNDATVTKVPAAAQKTAISNKLDTISKNKILDKIDGIFIKNTGCQKCKDSKDCMACKSKLLNCFIDSFSQEAFNSLSNFELNLKIAQNFSALKECIQCSTQVVTPKVIEFNIRSLLEAKFDINDKDDVYQAFDNLDNDKKKQLEEILKAWKKDPDSNKLSAGLKSLLPVTLQDKINLKEAPKVENLGGIWQDKEAHFILNFQDDGNLKLIDRESWPIANKHYNNLHYVKGRVPQIILVNDKLSIEIEKIDGNTMTIKKIADNSRYNLIKK
jgi:hypothetical protein